MPKRATEKQANDARDQHSESLRQAGAHAITVDEVTLHGNKTFAVIAMTENKSSDFPSELEVKSGNNTIKVPLVVKPAEKFKLE